MSSNQYRNQWVQILPGPITSEERIAGGSKLVGKIRLSSFVNLRLFLKCYTNKFFQKICFIY